MKLIQQLVNDNDSYKVCGASPLKDKLRYIESKTEVLRDLTFMLFHFIEPIYNEQVTEKINKLEFMTRSCIERYDELSQGKPELDTSVDFVELARSLCRMDLKSLSPNPQRERDLGHLAVFSNNVEHLKTFDLQEERMYKVIDNNCSYFEIFMIFHSLSYIASILDLHKRKLAQPISNKYFTLKTFFHLFMCIQDVFYGLCRPLVFKLTRKLSSTRDLNYSKLKMDHFMSYSIHCDDFDVLVGLCADELEYEEYILIESIINTRLEQDKILIGYNHDFDDKKLIEFFDDILEAAYKNLWVEKRVRTDASCIRTTNKKERKQLSKFIAERYDYYLAQFDSSMMYNHQSDESLELNEDLEETSASQELVENIEVEDDTLSTMKSLLGKREYLKYSNHTSRARQKDVEKILNYISCHKELLKDNLCRLTYIMKFSDVLPDIDNQCCTMRFGKIYFKNCLKLNITRGDRLVLYFDENDQLSIKYLTLQEYHKLRSA